MFGGYWGDYLALEGWVLCGGVVVSIYEWVVIYMVLVGWGECFGVLGVGVILSLWGGDGCC